MPTEIVMPQMGESIFEGTITKWLKKPGDKVQRDEPLFEISTDKVDAEIPAPAKPASVAQPAPSSEKPEKKEVAAPTKAPPAPERKEVIQFPHEEEDHA